MKTCALILAAGKGTRMPSQKPKVMQKLLGDTMLSCVYKALQPVINDNIFTLVGYKKEYLLDELQSISEKAHNQHIEQKELLGTGHALQTAFPSFKEANADYIMVINGDVPLLSSEFIQAILDKTKEENYDVVFATIMVEDVAKYGRVIRNSSNEVQAIVEAKDYSEEQYGKASGEINAGLYIFKASFAEEFLPKLNNNNANNEYYITDLISLAIDARKKVHAYNAGYDFSLLGCNNPLELSQAEEFLRKKRNENFMQNGVILHNPSTITISQDVEIEAGVEIYQNCELYGKTKISKYCVIESNCVIKNCEIGENNHIASFSHFENASVSSSCKIGPYARLRPSAKLEDNVHIGNFVEVKKSLIEKGAKVNHLTYIGDAEIGAGTNIGAGTITCNYDGKNKFLTKIGKNCFIGSNSAFVAPVEIGENALIGAGSVITKNVKENELVVARSKQVHLPKPIK